MLAHTHTYTVCTLYAQYHCYDVQFSSLHTCGTSNAWPVVGRFLWLPWPALHPGLGHILKNWNVQWMQILNPHVQYCQWHWLCSHCTNANSSARTFVTPLYLPSSYQQMKQKSGINLNILVFFNFLFSIVWFLIFRLIFFALFNI
jgi:hypothetical protein